jgi:hypothetical protein
MSHEETVYAEGTKLDAIVGFIGASIAVLIIATIILLTNNGNTPPVGTGIYPVSSQQ